MVKKLFKFNTSDKCPEIFSLPLYIWMRFIATFEKFTTQVGSSGNGQHIMLYCYKIVIFTGIKKGRYTFETRSRLKKDLDKHKKKPGSSSVCNVEPSGYTTEITQNANNVPKRYQSVQEEKFKVESSSPTLTNPVAKEALQNVELIAQKPSHRELISAIPGDQSLGNVSILHWITNAADLPSFHLPRKTTQLTHYLKNCMKRVFVRLFIFELKISNLTTGRTFIRGRYWFNSKKTDWVVWTLSSILSRILWKSQKCPIALHGELIDGF